MPKVFISYRREDSAAEAGRIFDRLVSKLGAAAIFFDINTIPFGADFRLYIKEVLMQCDVLLAIIGDDWLSAAYDDDIRKGQRRLDDPNDFVRTEIELALKNGLTVIPTLVAQAGMPEESKLPAALADLTSRNAAEARSGPDFHNQVNRLIQQIEQCSREIKQESGSESLVFQKVWYRERPARLVDLVPTWKGRKTVFQDIGLLIIRAEGIEFVGKKFQIQIKNIEKLSRGRQGIDLACEWVKIEYEEDNNQRMALLANGQYLGYAAVFNQNDELFEAIRDTYNVKDA
jgi:hypothetical protein